MKIMDRLITISRETFQPTYVREEWLEIRPWDCYVLFNFKCKEHKLPFFVRDGFLRIDFIVSYINDLIGDTGYQYYDALGGGQVAFLIVLTKEEANKLVNERGWELLTVNKKGRFILRKDHPSSKP